MTGKGRVLIVDDDHINRMMLTYRLELSGIEASTAENGRQALETLCQGLAAGDPFDLVLLDLLMPELDGFATLKALKHDDRLRGIPVVVMSAVGDMDSVIRCLEMGAEDYLPKPLDAMLLSSRVNAILLRIEREQVEQLYQRMLGVLTDAAAAASQGRLPAGALSELAGRPDAFGRLARELDRLATAADPARGRPADGDVGSR